VNENYVKQRLAGGGRAVGTMFMEFATSGIGRIAAHADAEFGVFDMEHSVWSHETIKMVCGTARGTSMIPMARVPALAGAMGLVAPFVDSPQQAQFVVECVKYPPLGRRGVAFNLSHDDYRGGNAADKMAWMNDETMVVVQIESSRGLSAVEEIAAVSGVDAVWIGQFDLTTSMGIAGQFDHPDYHAAVDRIRLACDRHGVAPGYGSLDLDELEMRRDQGFRFLVYTADVWIYQRALRAGIHRIQQR
jgi:2-dehydro-3-deoxyglucarate aldolase/4-hydroxy-2-oxoheptanedioate aldolase